MTQRHSLSHQPFRRKPSRVHTEKRRSSSLTQRKLDVLQDLEKKSRRKSSSPHHSPPRKASPDELGITPWVLTGKRSLIPPSMKRKYMQKHNELETHDTHDKHDERNKLRTKLTADWTARNQSVDLDLELGEGTAPLYLKMDPIPGVVPGFEALHDTQAVFMRREKDAMQSVSGYTLDYRYSIFNPHGQRIYFAGEASSSFNRLCLCCCAESRPFTLNVFDAGGDIVMRIERRCNCLLCCFGSNIAGGSVSVYMRSTKELIGRVVENCSCSTPSFTVFNKQGHRIANIMGPHCSSLVPCYLGGNIVFYMTDPQNGAAMGSIMKKFYMKDVLTDSSDFGFSLHGGDMDEVTKAIMIGAVFCIDFTFFGSEPANSDNIHWKWGCWKCSMCTVTIELVFLAAVVILIIFIVKPEWLTKIFK